MGIGTRQNMTPVYGANGQPTGMYINNFRNAPIVPAAPPPKSMTNEMLERARMASQNVNVPTIADLFPLMMQNLQLAQMTQAQAPMQSSGAGRFLGTSDTAPSLNFSNNTVT